MTQIPDDTPRGLFLRDGLAHLAERGRLLVMELRCRWQVRQSMGGLSARHLRDIGLTQGDLDAARHAPLSQDGASNLHIAANLRAKNW